MLETGALSTLPALRHRLPTLPHDLSEYAREQTGHASWSAHPQVDELSAWALEPHDDPACAMKTELLVDLCPTDVPCVVVSRAELARLVNHREAFVVASIDGSSTIEMMVDVVALPAAEVLEIIFDLCARGIVALR